jgi:peptidoglycan/LPS O-acetylase OafA/YrhL
MSYSLYLWQQLFFNPFSSSPISKFPLNLVAALAAASASYILVERPLLNLRRRFRRS